MPQQLVATVTEEEIGAERRGTGSGGGARSGAKRQGVRGEGRRMKRRGDDVAGRGKQRERLRRQFAVGGQPERVDLKGRELPRVVDDARPEGSCQGRGLDAIDRAEAHELESSHRDDATDEIRLVRAAPDGETARRRVHERG
ncbi:MAG: hypothetical protein U0575_16085 [Phycisphaerales bacterium]